MKHLKNIHPIAIYSIIWSLSWGLLFPLIPGGAWQHDFSAKGIFVTIIVGILIGCGQHFTMVILGKD